jgi:hypothetical protein
MVSKDFIDKLANQAATSPTNDLPEPSENQKKSGIYKKGHIRLHGLSISIENPEGSFRSGINSEGKPWKNKLYSHYGYFTGRDIGKDGDPVDVFIGPKPESKTIFIINQKNNEDKFDEHKVMMGWDKIKDAIEGYLKNYEPDWDGIMSAHRTHIDDFKNWLDNGNKKVPFRG